jgi:multidrug efflux pump subunit AcrB
MMLRFFIDRPKFSIVIALLMTLLGGIALLVIPVAQYPEITPPEVSVTAAYPGADAQVVADTVAAAIEAQVNGADHMLYMSSVSTNNGRYVLTITFAVGTNPDLAAVDVQNRVALAAPKLPQEVTAQGVSVKKKSSSTLMYVQLFSPDSSFDAIKLSNYMTTDIRDAIARVPGIGEATVIGAYDYSMRLWLRPDDMNALGITATDIVAALRAQNVQASAGQIGGAPAPEANARQLTLIAKGRLKTVDEFANVVIRTNASGAVVRLKDVSRIELGAQTYDAATKLNGKPSATLAIY